MNTLPSVAEESLLNPQQMDSEVMVLSPPTGAFSPSESEATGSFDISSSENVESSRVTPMSPIHEEDRKEEDEEKYLRELSIRSSLRQEQREDVSSTITLPDQQSTDNNTTFTMDSNNEDDADAKAEIYLQERENKREERKERKEQSNNYADIKQQEEKLGPTTITEIDHSEGGCPRSYPPPRHPSSSNILSRSTTQFTNRPTASPPLTRTSSTGLRQTDSTSNPAIRRHRSISSSSSSSSSSHTLPITSRETSAQPVSRHTSSNPPNRWVMPVGPYQQRDGQPQLLERSSTRETTRSTSSQQKDSPDNSSNYILLQHPVPGPFTNLTTRPMRKGSGNILHSNPYQLLSTEDDDNSCEETSSQEEERTQTRKKKSSKHTLDNNIPVRMISKSSQTNREEEEKQPKNGQKKRHARKLTSEEETDESDSHEEEANPSGANLPYNDGDSISREKLKSPMNGRTLIPSLRQLPLSYFLPAKSTPIGKGIKFELIKYPAGRNNLSPYSGEVPKDGIMGNTIIQWFNQIEITYPFSKMDDHQRLEYLSDELLVKNAKKLYHSLERNIKKDDISRDGHTILLSAYCKVRAAIIKEYIRQDECGVQAIHDELRALSQKEDENISDYMRRGEKMLNQYMANEEYMGNDPTYKEEKMRIARGIKNKTIRVAVVNRIRETDAKCSLLDMYGVAQTASTLYTPNNQPPIHITTKESSDSSSTEEESTYRHKNKTRQQKKKKQKKISDSSSEEEQESKKKKKYSHSSFNPKEYEDRQSPKQICAALTSTPSKENTPSSQPQNITQTQPTSASEQPKSNVVGTLSENRQMIQNPFSERTCYNWKNRTCS